MANKSNRYPDNAEGKFYVDDTCIDCDICRQTAPNNFRRNEEKGYSFVFKQPSNPVENGQCQEALEACPVAAIGDKGDE